MAALQAYVLLLTTEIGKQQLKNYVDFYNGEHVNEFDETAGPPTIPLQVSIGQYITEIEEPSEGLVLRTVQRLKTWKRTNPPAAAILGGLIQKWSGPAVWAESLRRMKSGESDIDSLVGLLASRKEIRERLPTNVSSLHGAKGLARGIGSCLAENRAEYLAIIEQSDPEAQRALLGCARLIRAALPVDQIGRLLNSSNKLLALAAERYLESEDSLEARKLVLAKNKGAARILGARAAFVPDAKFAYSRASLNEVFKSVGGERARVRDFPNMETKEKDLRKELADNPSLVNIYALMTNEPAGDGVIRLYKDRAVFTYYELEARYRQRDLTPEEYKGFIDLLVNENIDGQKPVLGGCDKGCIPTEFAMFNRDGGRRVFYENIRENPAFAKLREAFEGFQKTPGTLRYRLADKMPGLEVLLADDRSPVWAVWKKGNDLRIVVEDVEREEEIKRELIEKVRAAREKRDSTGTPYDPGREEPNEAYLSWRTFENGKLGGAAAQPAEAPFLYDQTQVRKLPGIDMEPRGWQVRSDGGEIRTGGFSDPPGLFRTSNAQGAVKIKDGNYGSPIVTPDGEWVIAAKNEESPDGFHGIVRINLQTGKEFPVNLLRADQMAPIAFVYSRNKVLVFNGKKPDRDYDAEEDNEDEEEIYGIMPVNSTGMGPLNLSRILRLAPLTREYYLVDAATGVVQRVRGEFGPLEDQTYRPLQPTGIAGEFWAAIYDEKTRISSIGRYSDKTFTFRPVLNIPDIELDSMDVWVDEPGGKVYFVYEGHLLALPLR